MEHAPQVNTKKYSRKEFWKRFKKNLNLELENSWRILALVIISILGFFLFLFGFALVKGIFDEIKPYIIIFLVGSYLTLLPFFVIVGLLFVTLFKPQIAFGILGLSVISSFFILVLI